MNDTTFSDSYIETDAILEAMIGANPSASAVALKALAAASVAILGAYDMIVHNTGHVTENSGSSTGTGSEQTIAHGLGFTPTRQQVILIAGSATANPFHSSAPDATNIYVTAGNGQDWYWNVP